MNILKFVLIGIVVAMVVLGVLIGSQFVEYKKEAFVNPDFTAPIKVAIIDPDVGTEAPAGVFLPVSVLAVGENPLLSIELWANGELVAVQAARPGGLSPMNTGFVWIPPAPGAYALVARAIDDQQHTGISSVVQVTVSQPSGNIEEYEHDDPAAVVPVIQGSGGEGSAPAPASVPPAALPMAPLDLPEGTEIYQAAEWNPSLVDWIGSLLNQPLPPKAPVLLKIEVDGCEAKLFIKDKIDNEDGYNVYRQDQGSSDFVLVDTRGPHEIVDYFYILDPDLVAASYNYYVTSFNSGGESPSNLKSIEITTDTCPPPVSDTPVLTLESEFLEMESNAEQLYCYKSLDGINWSRWPAEGFFSPGLNGAEMPALAAITLANSEELALGLHLDCWSWNANQLEWLGELHQEAIPATAGNLSMQGSGLSIGVEIGMGHMEAMDWDEPDPPPIDPKMPRVFAMILYGAEVCKDHTPSGGESIVENLLFCWPWPGYEVGEQPFLVWWVTDDCLAGKGDACNPLAYYASRAEDTGGFAGFNVYAQFSDVYPLLTTPTDLSAWAIEPPQNGCGTNVKYLNVRMYYLGGPEDPDFPNQAMQGPESNTVNTFPFCPAPEEVELEVVISSISFGDLGDGIGGGDDLEIYGWISATGFPGTGAARSLRPWGNHGDCADDNYEGPVLNTMGALGCPTTVKEQGYAFSEFYLCDSTLAAPNNCTSDYEEFNNKIPITVGGGGLIQIAVHLTDWDHQSGNDPVCNVEAWIGPQSIFGWMGYSEAGYMVQGDNDNASCQVNFHIKPVEE